MPRDSLDLPPGLPPAGLERAAGRILTGWLFLAIGSLAAAGALALLLAALRTPGLQDWLPWPWQAFFRKALVAHVVFAFVVWFLAMLGGLAASTLPGAWSSRAGLVLAAAGAGLLLVTVLADLGEPSLNNYVPVLIHPLFYAGLGVLALGIALPVSHLLIRPPAWGGALALGVGAAGALFLLALAAIALAWLRRPPGTVLADYNEILFWGGGHLLQFVNTALLLTAWQVLGEKAFGRAPLGPWMWKAALALLVLGGLPGPAFYGAYAPGSESLRGAFTALYALGLPWGPLLALGALARAVRRGPRPWGSPEFLGLILSAAAFILGGAMGMFADGADTRTPAHYHMEIGAVNLAFMGLFAAMLLPAVGRPLSGNWAARLQFWLYFGGQSLFALGLFAAGVEGVARKVAGAEQGLDSAVKLAAMAATGLGGLAAVAGGVLFVWLVLSRLARPKAY